MCPIQNRRVRGFIAKAVFKVEGFEVWARVFDSRSKGSRFGRLVSFSSRRVRGLGACARFKIEGFEVWSLGFFLRTKGSRFGRACLIPKRRIRGLVALVFSVAEEFEIWARAIDSRSMGFEVWSLGLFLTSKGSRFGRVCSIQNRRVRGFAAWAFFKVYGFDV